MGWSFHRSLNLGGVRLNFSKSGVGASVGMRGLRLGVRPDGRQYVRCGANGIYYQRVFGDRLGQRGRPGSGRPNIAAPSPAMQNTTGATQVVHSAESARMFDSTSAGLLIEIQRRLNSPPWHLWACAAGLIVTVLSLFLQSTVACGLSIALTAVGATCGYMLYRRCCQTEIEYHLDPSYGQIYGHLVAGFQELRKSSSLWQVDTTTAVRNSKYHAGATSVLSRTRAAPLFNQPFFLRSNLQFPMLVARNRTVCFLPDMLLLVHGRNVGAVSYYHLAFGWRTTSFIEDGIPPRDAKQVGLTWRFVNKSGGPDRRFADNRELPVMEYAELKFESATGLYEQFQASSVARTQAFVQGLSELMKYSRAHPPHRPAPNP